MLFEDCANETPLTLSFSFETQYHIDMGCIDGRFCRVLVEHCKEMRMRKSALKIVVLYLLLMTCFCALMTISYCIPVELLHLNGEESAKLLEEEGSYPKSYISGIAYDNYTCAVMINEAVHGGGV